MLQAQQQRKMTQKSTTQILAASLPASAAPSEDGSTVQNGMTAETSSASTQVVPDTDVDSDSDMPARQSSVTAASHDSDTEVSCSMSLMSVSSCHRLKV